MKPFLQIPLTQGRFTLIDEADMHLFAAGNRIYMVKNEQDYQYAGLYLNGKVQLLHRIILGLGND